MRSVINENHYVACFGFIGLNNTARQYHLIAQNPGPVTAAYTQCLALLLNKTLTDGFGCAAKRLPEW